MSNTHLHSQGSLGVQGGGVQKRRGKVNSWKSHNEATHIKQCSKIVREEVDARHGTGVMYTK